MGPRLIDYYYYLKFLINNSNIYRILYIYLLLKVDERYLEQICILVKEHGSLILVQTRLIHWGTFNI